MSRQHISYITFVIWWKEEALSKVSERDKHFHKEAQLVPSDGFDVFMPHVQEASNPFGTVAAISQGLAGAAAHHGRQNCQTQG